MTTKTVVSDKMAQILVPGAGGLVRGDHNTKVTGNPAFINIDAARVPPKCPKVNLSAFWDDFTEPQAVRDGRP